MEMSAWCYVAVAVVLARRAAARDCTRCRRSRRAETDSSSVVFSVSRRAWSFRKTRRCVSARYRRATTERRGGATSTMAVQWRGDVRCGRKACAVKMQARGRGLRGVAAVFGRPIGDVQVAHKFLKVTPFHWPFAGSTRAFFLRPTSLYSRLERNALPTFTVMWVIPACVKCVLVGATELRSQESKVDLPNMCTYIGTVL